MWQIIVTILLFLLSSGLMLVMRSFASMSLREMKRQARKGNLLAARAYTVRGVYGAELWVLIWLIVGLASAGMVVLLNTVIWTWLALLLSALLLLLSISLLPRLKKPSRNLKLAARVSPILRRVLGIAHPLLKIMTTFSRRFIDDDPYHLVHSREEIIEILEHAQKSGNLSSVDVKLAVGALTYSEKQIGEVMVPFSEVRRVKADALLSPVELAELHDSGFSRFPVMEGGRCVGTLYLKDAVRIRTNKTVREVMRTEVYYVNEAESLDHALKAFLKTKHHMFLVANEFEDVVGIITVEDVLEQILGQRIGDDFDLYDDISSVAKIRVEKQDTSE